MKPALRARVANLLRLHRLSLELKKEHDRVLKLSVTDDVSGFNNTRYLHRYLDRFMSAPDAQDQELSLVFFDLDNFKRVVDTHGHLLGSKILKEVAQAISRELDEDDRIVRYGGDEFVVILPRQGKEPGARQGAANAPRHRHHAVSAEGENRCPRHCFLRPRHVSRTMPTTSANCSPPRMIACSAARRTGKIAFRFTAAARKTTPEEGEWVLAE